MTKKTKYPTKVNLNEVAEELRKSRNGGYVSGSLIAKQAVIEAFGGELPEQVSEIEYSEVRPNDLYYNRKNKYIGVQISVPYAVSYDNFRRSTRSEDGVLDAEKLRTKYYEVLKVAKEQVKFKEDNEQAKKDREQRRQALASEVIKQLNSIEPVSDDSLSSFYSELYLRTAPVVVQLANNKVNVNVKGLTPEQARKLITFAKTLIPEVKK